MGQQLREAGEDQPGIGGGPAPQEGLLEPPSLCMNVQTALEDAR